MFLTSLRKEVEEVFQLAPHFKVVMELDTSDFMDSVLGPSLHKAPFWQSQRFYDHHPGT